MRSRDSHQSQLATGSAISLVDLEFDIIDGPLPKDVRLFLREAERRIRRFQREHHIPAFVAGDYVRIYRALSALVEGEQASGDLFCEWGSGYGVSVCLAAMLDFDAVGIEIESDLVDGAEQLADDFGLPVEFVCGSFIPKGGEELMGDDERFSWLSFDESDAYIELGIGPEEFNIILAYPWPDEEWITADLFERFAGADALLLTHHVGEDFRLRKKA